MVSNFIYRPIPVKGESLSGYLMRTATNNYLDMFDVIRKFTSNRLKEIQKYHQIESNPEGKLSADLLEQYTGLKLNELYDMTFLPLYHKFIKEKRTNIECRKSILNIHVEVQHRRFCPHCLQQYDIDNQRGVFQLIWQIKDIELCDIHHTPLMSTCPNCGIKQPYITNSLGNYTCFKCGAKLYVENKIYSYNSVLKGEQDRLYSDWVYLLDNETKDMEILPDLKYEVQMAITLLYVLQRKDFGNFEAIRIPLMKKEEKAKALSFIKKRDANLYVTPYRLIKILDRADVTLEDFFTSKVPKDYIELLAKHLDVKVEKLAYFEKKKIYKKHKSHKIDSQMIKASVRKYIFERPNSNKMLTNNEIYSSISISRSSVSSEVTSYISDTVKKYNKQQKEIIYQDIEDLALMLTKAGKSFTYQDLADRVGVDVMFIKRNKDITRKIKSIRQTSC